MTNNELYLNISQLIDKAFKEQENRDKAMEGRLNDRMDIIENRMDIIENTMDRFDEKLDHVEESLNAKIDMLDAKIDHVEETLNVKIDMLDAKVDAVQENLSGKIQLINLQLENDVVPRLHNIENCYMSTSLRYQENVDKMERMQIDIDVLKSVVGKHEMLLCGQSA